MHHNRLELFGDAEIKKNIKLCKMKNQKLFNHMRDEHDLILLESEMREIRNIVMEENTEQCQIANVSHRFLT